MKFIYKLKLKDTETDFGLGKGILITREVSFKNWLNTDSPTMLAAAMLDHRNDMIDEFIDVVIEEVK